MKGIVITILISAVITFLIRALPFIFFNGSRQMPEKVRKLGEVLPSAIMAVLIVYCLKDSEISSNLLCKLVAVVAVAITYKQKHNTLISILIGTLCYMLLIRGVLFF